MILKTLHVGYIQTNCYLVMNETTGEGLIVDPGLEEKKIKQAIEEMGMKPVAILLTHGHFDHIMAVNELKSLYPDIMIYAMADEAELLAEPILNCSNKVIRKPYVVKPDFLLEDGQEFTLAGFIFKAISTPGHTLGSGCYYCEKEKLLFSGDTLFFENIGRTDFPTGSMLQIIDSLQQKLAPLPEETIVYPGHGESTAIGYEKRNNSYMQRRFDD